MAGCIGLLLLVGCTRGARSTAPRSPWDADLDALLTGIERVHPDPWWRISRADFVARVRSAARETPGTARLAAGTVSPTEFFDPANIERIFRAARAA